VSEPDLEPLPEELLRLLAAERSRPAPPAALEARVLARIGSALLAEVPLTGPAAAKAPPTLPVSRFRRLPLAAGLVALGGLGGAGVHALLNQPRPMMVAPAAPAPAAPAPAAQAPVPEVIDPAPPARTEPRPEPQVPVRQRLPRDGELAAERALLEQARTALARGKPADALALLSRHEREFAKGRLVEERQALTILSLAADHQIDAARANAVKFRRRFPSSMLLRTIDAALETSP
jgi:hypothetical protein